MEALRDEWLSHWNEALALWSRWTRLSEPTICLTTQEAEALGFTGSFAGISYVDHKVVINLQEVVELGIDDYPLEVFSHEIGHHVLSAGDLEDYARMLARLRRGLPGKENRATAVGNLYSDLLINDRLMRTTPLRMAEIFQILAVDSQNPLWNFYMRIYEIQWSLPRRSLAQGNVTPDMDGDAQLGARLIRSYASDWMRGCGRFAMLCLRYLDDDEKKTQRLLQSMLDMANSNAGVPNGLTTVEPDEITGAIHPSQDPELSGVPVGTGPDGAGTDTVPGPAAPPSQSSGQNRSPFEYGQLLKALGVDLTDHEIAVRYYRERASPHLVPFPTKRAPESTEPLPEGLEAWDVGSPLEDVDWLESVLVSPRPVPGLTTRQRVYGTVGGSDPAREPIDLDLYVDCSGSMPNPQVQESFLTLAGAIMARSALRVGAAVQVTLWSGPGQFEKTSGFIRDENEVLRVLTGYLNGSTAFPLHILRNTYAKKRKRAAHIMVISDDGVDTMLNKDEKGNPGLSVATAALAAAGGGGSLVLRLFRALDNSPNLAPLRPLFDIYPISQWDELIAFARAFSRRAYGDRP